MVTATRNKSQGALSPYVRIGVGGRWSAEELQLSLNFLLKSTGWSVMTRPAGELCVESPGTSRESLQASSVAGGGMVEIVPLGDGLSQVVGLPESEELDAVVISPLSESDADANGMTARRYLARFVRQLRPGGATIFAADDPVSDIFSVIRLDCRRLGYTFDGESSASRTAGMAPQEIDSAADETDSDDTDPAERTRLAMAAMAVVQAFGLGVQETTGSIGALIS